mgnify:CR=1 FL=1|jgi:hypothetical protein|tara:strand:- start:2875 stop:3069 length:195 start_codon:yes stop_codon:yes gene_type:complete
MLKRIQLMNRYEKEQYQHVEAIAESMKGIAKSLILIQEILGTMTKRLKELEDNKSVIINKSKEF